MFARLLAPVAGLVILPALAAGCARTDAMPGCGAAAAYSRAEHGVSLVVLHEGRVVCEDYAPLWGPFRRGPMASGVKSFSAVLAAAAVQDGLLRLDERVADTLPEWRSDPAKRTVTVRQLLSLSSGLYSREAAPTRDQAVAAPLVAAPGRQFIYNAAPFQVFGELLRRKLDASGGESLEDYFARRIGEPLGIRAGWMRAADGSISLGTGASITARDWARFGELVRLGGASEGVQLVDRPALQDALSRPGANPAYVLGWWRTARTSAHLPSSDVWGADAAPSDTVLAVGAGKQRLYVFPSLNLVVVRQAVGEPWSPDAASTGFSDAAFLGSLLGAARRQSDPPALR